MRAGSCEVWLTCDGDRLPEYSVTTSEENSVTCYIPSEAGKAFTIHGKNDYDEIIALSIAFDSAVKTTMLAVDPGKTNSKWGVRTGPMLRQPFRFSEVVTVEDDDVLQRNDNAHLGTIRLMAKRMRWKANSERKPTWSPVQATGPVHEQSKKAGTHCIAFGAPVSVRPESKLSSEYLDQSPIVNFVFHYRPLALLQAQGLAPLSQSNGLRPQPGASGSKVEPPQSQLAASSSGPQSQPGTSRRRAEQKSDEPQAESSRPTKRARAGSEDRDTKPGVDTESDDEGELSTLKGQLQQIMSKIDRMERKRARKAGGSRRVAKKEEPADVTFVSGELIDLTVSD